MEQLWKEEAQYRPSFKTEGGVVYVPNLFSKVCGVDKGGFGALLGPHPGDGDGGDLSGHLLPFLKLSGPSMSAPQSPRLPPQRRLDPKALKASQFYRYGYLPDDTRTICWKKSKRLWITTSLQAGRLDRHNAVGAHESGQGALRLLQNFDFTRTIPKFLVVDVTETLFSLEECILLAFLNLVGFDIAVFTPTGYRNLEAHLRPDSFDTLTAGNSCSISPFPTCAAGGPRNPGAGWDACSAPAAPDPSAHTLYQPGGILWPCNTPPARTKSVRRPPPCWRSPSPSTLPPSVGR